MKAKHLLKKTITAVICFGMIYTAKAQTTANSLTDLQTQFATAVASGVPSTINIGAAITVNTNLPLVSTGDSITLNFAATPAYPLTVSAGTLTIGNKVKITSALGNCIQALAGGTVVINSGCNIVSSATAPITAAGGNVIINGGRISTTNYPALSAGSSFGVGGILTINGGYIASAATGTLTRGIVVDYGGTCIVNGGEIHADPSVSGRAISINSTSTGGKIYIYGGTITALGTSGRAIQLDNNNSTLFVNGSPIITGGLEAIIAQKFGVVVLSGTPILTGVIGTNATTSKLYDARGLSNIVATPGTGAYKTSQNVTVTGGTGTIYKYVNTTAQASATTLTSTPLVYTTDGTVPVAASTTYSTPVTVAVPSVLTVAPYIDATVVGSPAVFNYSFSVGTDVSQVQASDLFKCYPSQVTDKLIVKADAETQISQVVVRNLLGQSIKSVVVNANELSIDLTAVSAGNYFVTVKLANGQSATQKIVKL
jgi:hypothetical protein